MEIYIIMEHEKYGDSSHVHSAYISETEANIKAETLNKEEELKEQKYNEWIEKSNESMENELDDDEEFPEWGDSVYTVTKTFLHKESTYGTLAM